MCPRNTFHTSMTAEPGRLNCPRAIKKGLCFGDAYVARVNSQEIDYYGRRKFPPSI